MSRKRTYTKEMKAAVLQDHWRGEAVTTLCDAYGISPALFYRWQEDYLKKATNLIDRQVQSLVTKLTKLAGYSEIPDTWQDYLKKRFTETRGHLSVYASDRKTNEKVVEVMKLIHQNIDNLRLPYTKEHNRADYIRMIAGKVGKTEETIRRQIKRYNLYWNVDPEAKPLSAIEKQSILEGISDAIGDETFKKELG